MPMSKRLYAKVVIPSLNIEYLDYYTDNLKAIIGQVVSVPFKSKEKLGIIFALSETTELDIEKIRPISIFLDQNAFRINFLKFIQAAASYYYDSTNNFLKLALVNDDLFKPCSISKVPDVNKIIEQTKLSDEQSNVLKILLQNYAHKDYQVNLLQGITGSGKTEVYLSLAQHVMHNVEKGGQVLILLPEIALTNQLIAMIENKFGFKPAIWHSETKPREKRRIYQGILSGEISLIIGARSALFLPYQNLRLLVVDEEHDQSYKQEEKTLYHARDMAVYRAFYEKFMVLLVSATPSIETIANVTNGKYQQVSLLNRFGGNKIPIFRVIDLRHEQVLPNCWISNSLRAEILNVLAKGEQVLLYLNRRGYAPLSICSHCGFRLTCPNCSTWLVEHKADSILKCHHCGYSKKNHNICPSCKSKDTLKPCGPGVERIAEEVRSFLPEISISIITKDTTKTVLKAQELFNEIRENKTQVIIGTQMIAKGHHFPNLTLVGIIDADIGFTGGDLRATEKTYQLLEQVSGRSGREKPGKVVIQTYNAENKLLNCIIKNDREGFVEEEIKLRKFFKMPPFTKLITILISSKREEVALNFAKMLVNKAPRSKDIEVYGPSPAQIVRIKNQFRYRILIKISKSLNYNSFLKAWLSKLKVPHYINLRVDIDPYNFI
jgi:primosomal protein N' (replication factor Y)